MRSLFYTVVEFVKNHIISSVVTAVVVIAVSVCVGVMAHQHSHPEFTATEPTISVGGFEGTNALPQGGEPLPTEEITESSSEPVVEVTEPSVEVTAPLEPTDSEPTSPSTTEPLPTEPAKPTEATPTEPAFTEASPTEAPVPETAPTELDPNDPWSKFAGPADLETGLSWDGVSPIIYTYTDGTTGTEPRPEAMYELCPGVFRYLPPDTTPGELYDGHCKYCGREGGDGANGTCLRFWRGGDHTCEHCGVVVPQDTCHSCAS